MVVLAILRFIGPNEEDENGIVLSRFFTCNDGVDLSDKVFAGAVTGATSRALRAEGVITDSHVCCYLGMREIVHAEIAQLYIDTLPREPTDGN